jgi:hypothetical protein
MPPRGATATAWTSDRIGIRPPPHKPPAQKSDKGKGRANTPEPARSAAVRKLDELLTGLRSSSRQNTTTPDDGCFCQGARPPTKNAHSHLSHYTARIHQPSEYTPICTSCGLILCTLHLPHRPCPSCSSQLLDTPTRTALIVQIEERRAQTLEEEAAMRARAAEELRLAEGAFPALGGGAAPGTGIAGGAGKGGVLSFDEKTKRVKVEAYRVTSAPADVEGDGVEDGMGRVPPPESLREVQYLRVPRGPATRWTVSRDGQGGAKYVAAPEHSSGRRGKGKAGGGA